MLKFHFKLLIFFPVLLVYSCIPILRSSQGIKPGHVQVSYNAPFAGDIRVGLTDNIEYRFSVIGESYETDLMVHFHKELDYSFSIGTQWLPDWEKDQFHLSPLNAQSNAWGLTVNISKEYWHRVNPYLGMSYSRKFWEKESAKFYATGCEMMVFKKNKSPINFVLTPEIIFIPGGTGGDFDSNVWGSLGLGINIDLEKLNKK